MKKVALSSFVLAFLPLLAFAQSGTNSPYSQFGLGVLSDQSQGFNRGMGGLAYGLRSGNQVNSMNPASYSAVDSLALIFDVGLSGQITRFKEGNTSRNANNADFEYAVAAFRLAPRLGMSVGILPYTNIGYSYSTTSRVGTSETTSTESYSGSGGIHQAYLGLGWRVLGGLSVGANIGYLWGTYDKSISLASSDAYVNTMTRTYEATVKSYKLDFGVQWQQQLGKTDWLTVGLTYGLGHNLKADATMNATTSNSQTSISNQTIHTVENALSIPHSFGAGLAWNHGYSLTLGADYSLQQWGSLSYPTLNETTGQYALADGMLSDRHKVTVGAQWLPNPLSRNFFSRIRYRLGASYATSYFKVNGHDGPKEYSVSGGFGIPITSSGYNRSMLNISAQWVHSSANDLLTENTFRINIGLTFNERWFMKWKVE